jgi:MoxR-like ATPase
MSLVNPDALKALDNFVRRVYVDGEDAKKVISEMLRSGDLKEYEVVILAKAPYQFPVQAVLYDGHAENAGSVVTFFDVFTGQYKLNNATKPQPHPSPDHHYTVKITNIEVGRLVFNNVEYNLMSFVPITTVGKVKVIGKELLFKSKGGFIKPYMVIVDIAQPTVNALPLDQVFKILPIEVNGDPRKNLFAVLDIYAPHIVGQNNAKTALLLSAVGAGPTQGRFTIHPILIGEPGTGKTALAQEMHMALPRSAIIEVTHSTETSMVVAASADGVYGNHELMLGPLPLLSGDYLDFGVVFLNEAQNLREPQKLIPVLDGSEISITKAGKSINIQVNVSVVLLMNPVLGGPWDPSNLMVNFPRTFTPALLSRFDAIIVLYHPTDEGSIREIVRAIREGQRGLRTDYAVLQSIIRYARLLDPREKSDVEEYVEDAIVELNKKYSDEGLPTPPRNIERVMRLIRAIAKLTLQTEINKEVVDFAVGIIEGWLDVMSNPKLGIVMAGSDRRNAMLLLEIMKTDCTKDAGGCTSAELVEKFEGLFTTPDAESQFNDLISKKGFGSVASYVEYLLTKLYMENYVYKCGAGRHCVVTP